MAAAHSASAADELLGPRCPPELHYLWDWFVELSAGRTSNGFGGNPLGWTEIESWSRLSRLQLLPYERRALLVLDRRYLRVMSVKK